MTIFQAEIIGIPELMATIWTTEKALRDLLKQQRVQWEDSVIWETEVDKIAYYVAFFDNNTVVYAEKEKV